MPEFITSKNIQGISDLVVRAPIKQGFIPAFENVTYETRLRFATKAFYKLRNYAREYELIFPFTETAERIQSLLDFRIGIQEEQPQRSLILAATFDRGWEPYMRTIWDPLGAFLDVLLCNCEDYDDASAGDHSFAEFAKWVRKYQVDSTIFYATKPLTLGDQQYLSKLERVQRNGRLDGGSPLSGKQLDLEIAKLTLDNPEDTAAAVRAKAFGAPGGTPDELTRQKLLTMSIEALEVLYRLADYYPADNLNGDGKYLLRAAQSLFKEWDTKGSEVQLPAVVKQFKQELFAWYNDTPPPRSPIPADPKFDASEVQAGVISGYDTPIDKPIQHGALLLFRVRDAKQAGDFIREHVEPSFNVGGLVVGGGDLTTRREGVGLSFQEPPEAARAPAGPPAGAPARRAVFTNLAITYEGFKSLQLAPAIIEALPREFVEGAADRAMQMGDIARNHPGRWTLPGRFDFTDNEPRVELSEVDVILQLRTAGDPNADNGDWGYVDLPNKRCALEKCNHPLKDAILNNLKLAETSGMVLLSILPMRRIAERDENNSIKTHPDGGIQMRDHFGFIDAVSQPAVDRQKTIAQRDIVKRGEILLGYGNDRGDPPAPPVPPDEDSSPVPPDKARPGSKPKSFLFNGSFLVIRKMRQDLGALDEALDPDDPRRGRLLAKMMGRDLKGRTLVKPPLGKLPNDFNYKGDSAGVACPFQAHIRRANPRLAAMDGPPFGRPLPRIMRRGMSYGPTRQETREDPRRGNDRGIIFMAYNSSLAEQFEVIQRWINGGNATNVSSAQNDPLFGTFPAEGGKTFRFVEEVQGKQRVVRVSMPDPTVTLDWGLYAFTPSRAALQSIVKAGPLPIKIGQCEKGEEILGSLRQMAPDDSRAAWKCYLEDFTTKDPDERSDSPDLWRAIRENHKGAVAGPDQFPGRGKVVIVASDGLINHVLADNQNYSVKVQNRRMKRSIGEIYVGIDEGERYKYESVETNDLLMRVTKPMAFAAAFEAATEVLYAAILAAKTIEQKLGVFYPIEFDARSDFLSPTLEAICQYWFGLPDSDLIPVPEADKKPSPPFILAGGWNWQPPSLRKPRCPGDFMAPSRWCFYPDPTIDIEQYGIDQGQKLRRSARKWADHHRPTGVPKSGKPPLGELAADMFDFNSMKGNDLLARTMVGIMVGALPPMDGNLRAALYDWLQNKSFWRWQSKYLAVLKTELDDLTAKGISAPAGSNARIEAVFKAAQDAIEPNMRTGMLKRPAPDLLFRTAIKPHSVGNVAVNTGDKIVLVIASATQEKLDAQRVDVYTIFGGQRKDEVDSVTAAAEAKAAAAADTLPPTHEAASHPLHACPAYDMAMGTMLGILTALMDIGQIEALPAPLLMRMTPTIVATNAAEVWAVAQTQAAEKAEADRQKAEATVASAKVAAVAKASARRRASRVTAREAKGVETADALATQVAAELVSDRHSAVIAHSAEALGEE